MGEGVTCLHEKIPKSYAEYEYQHWQKILGANNAIY